MTTIEKPHEQAAALRAHAAAMGLSLEAWLLKDAMTTALPAGASAQSRSTPSWDDVSPSDPDSLSRARAAVSRIKEIREQSKPDPDGLTVQDYLNIDRRR